MPEVLGDAGVYFDPESVDDIVKSLEKLIHNPSLREELAHRAYSQSQCFGWEQCAEKTFSFLAEIARAYKKCRADASCTLLSLLKLGNETNPPIAQHGDHRSCRYPRPHPAKR
jgi:hypothetical protein